MSKKISLGAAIAIAAVIASITFCVTMLFSQNIFNSMISNVNRREEMYDKVEEIYATVTNNELLSIDEETLIDSLGEGMLNGLNDTYAQYYTKAEYETLLKEEAGDLAGIGIKVKKDSASEYIYVYEVIENTTAQSAGLQNGDLIVKIEDTDVAQAGYDNAVKMLEGEAGTKLKITVRRNGEDSEYEIPRKKFEYTGITYKMIDDNGYIKIAEFNDSTPSAFKLAVKDLISQGAKGIIFDLRNNGGGSLQAAGEMLDYLLPEGTVYQTVNKNSEVTGTFTSDESQVNINMTTLINGSTASSAELFAAALKDYNKSGLVGTTTFGKGVCQTTYALSDGSAIKITTEYLNTPSGENYDGVGIQPDYEVTLTKEEEENFVHLDETTDPQLIKAISVITSEQN